MRKQTGFQVSQFSLIVLCTKTPKPLASLWQWAAGPQPADPRLSLWSHYLGGHIWGRKRVGPSPARGEAGIVARLTVVITMHLRLTQPVKITTSEE